MAKNLDQNVQMTHSETIKKSALELLIEDGIPCKEAVFHRSIKSFNASKAGEPETALYDAATKAKPSRTAKLWYTPHGLIYQQKFGSAIVPLANVVYSVSL